MATIPGIGTVFCTSRKTIGLTITVHNNHHLRHSYVCIDLKFNTILEKRSSFITAESHQKKFYQEKVPFYQFCNFILLRKYISGNIQFNSTIYNII